MYVNGPGAIKNPDKTKKKNQATSGHGFSEVLAGTADTAASASVSSGQTVSLVNGLFMLQQVDDERTTAQRAVSHGHDILDVLEDVRLVLLTGKVHPSTLENLQQKLEHWKEEYDDPKLQRIIKEIELRAAVELAKLGKA